MKKLLKKLGFVVSFSLVCWWCIVWTGILLIIAIQFNYNLDGCKIIKDNKVIYLCGRK